MNKQTKIKCPHCGEYAFFKEKKIYDDSFALTGVKYICFLCGGEADIKPENNTSGHSNSKLDKLSQFLGGESVSKVSLDLAGDEVRFCCHCAHFIKHPFLNRCGITLKEVEATDSCGNFKAQE